MVMVSALPPLFYSVVSIQKYLVLQSRSSTNILKAVLCRAVVHDDSSLSHYILSDESEVMVNGKSRRLQSLYGSFI